MGCGESADDCGRAFARLERIDASKGNPVMKKPATDRMIEVCRTGKHASYDPVLRCAIDSSTDEAAAECIDRGMKEVLKGSAGEGAGVNPLLP